VKGREGQGFEKKGEGGEEKGRIQFQFGQTPHCKTGEKQRNIEGILKGNRCPVINSWHQISFVVPSSGGNNFRSVLKLLIPLETRKR
jgi:hypothetical protein